MVTTQIDPILDGFYLIANLHLQLDPTIKQVLEITKNSRKDITSFIPYKDITGINNIRIINPTLTSEEYSSFQSFKPDSIFLKNTHILKSPIPLEKENALGIQNPWAFIWLEPFEVPFKDSAIWYMLNAELICIGVNNPFSEGLSWQLHDALPTAAWSTFLVQLERLIKTPSGLLLDKYRTFHIIHATKKIQ